MTNMIQDIQNMNSGLLGKLYYVRCKDDERYFKTIRFFEIKFKRKYKYLVS